MSEKELETVDLATEYTQTLETVRHYSRLRIPQLAAFFAVTGALMLAQFNSHFVLSSRVYRILLGIAGLCLNVAFLSLEVMHDSYKSAFIRRAIEIYPESHWKFRPVHLANRVRNAFRALYVVIAVIWVSIIFIAVID